jgi:uncharacterized protein DUF4238
MSVKSLKPKTRNRYDHVVPRSYLSGFIHPSRAATPKKLWVFDVRESRWMERSPKEIGGEVGFYDYSFGSKPDQTADEVFASLERQFPLVRATILETGFAAWRQHLDFLLEYFQMLRARSFLFRKELTAQAERSKFFELTEFVRKERNPNDPAGSGFDVWKTTEVAFADPREKQRLLKNKAITDMRGEIEKGSDWFQSFHWALRYTNDPNDSVITSDNCLVVTGDVADRESSLTHPGTLVFLALSWQACLIGSPQQFNMETDAFHPADLIQMRSIFAANAERFIISPCKLDFGPANSPS